MFKSKYGNVLTVLLIIVIVAILGVLGYFGYDLFTQKSKEKQAAEAIDEFDKEIPTIVLDNSNNTTEENSNNTNMTFENNSSSNNSSSKGKSKKVYVAGYEMIGKIRIPATKIEYPILSEVTRKSLENGVAQLFTVNGLNKPGNTVIVGHNYRNSLYFSKNDQLKKGDKVYIKDTSGLEVEYIIYDIFETTSTDASFYQRETKGKREITLSTCTDDANKTDKRIIIFAKEK